MYVVYLYNIHKVHREPHFLSGFDFGRFTNADCDVTTELSEAKSKQVKKTFNILHHLILVLWFDSNYYIQLNICIYGSFFTLIPGIVVRIRA